MLFPVQVRFPVCPRVAFEMIYIYPDETKVRLSLLVICHLCVKVSAGSEDLTLQKKTESVPGSRVPLPCIVGLPSSRIRKIMFNF